jgi:Domain of unknown function (DUF4386)
LTEAKLELEKGETTESKYHLDLNWKTFYKTSAILLVLTGIIWVAVSRLAGALYPSGVPTDASTYLQLVSQHQALAAATWSLWIVADILVIPPILALYLILRHVSRTLALVGAAVALIFPIFDVSVSELNSLALVSLSNGYASASTPALQAPYVAAATYGLALLPLETFISYALSIGFVVLGVAMLKSGLFRRGATIFGIAIMGIATVGSLSALVPSSTLLGLLFFISVPGAGLWLILVGAQLFRHSRRLEAPKLTKEQQASLR